ncbi:unnamed protein product [Urochloa humidicola]
MASSSRRGRGERAASNLEHFVRTALERGGGWPSAVGGGRGVGGLGLAAVVPASLGRTTNIEHILQADDNVEDPNVPPILCEQAYTMAQNLDPSSERRGILQFEIGLQSVIKQKLAKKDGAPIDRQNDFQVLWNYYQEYKSRRQVEDTCNVKRRD